MHSKIRRIWMAWLGAMVLLVAATWALAMVPLPGLSSSSSPTIEDVLGFFRHIGIFGTVKMIAVLFLPPIVLTYLETRKIIRNGVAGARTTMNQESATHIE